MGEELLVLSHPNLTLSEQFNNVFPYYLAIGMTYELFWHGDASLPKYYREADELKRRMDNQKLWIQGMYIYDAFCCVAPILHPFAKKGTKAKPYPTEPYSLSEKERKACEETTRKRKFEEMKSMFSTWATKANQKIKSKGAGKNGNDD